jgi:transcriptional regulator with XRE-family HTH domain
MATFGDEEARLLYAEWRMKEYGFALADRLVEPFLHLDVEGSWIKRSREALYLSKRSLAGKLKICSNAYWELERSEAAGSISINNLKRCAEAMGCELVYAIRPKIRQCFSRIIWNVLFEAVKDKRPDWCTSAKDRFYRLKFFIHTRMWRPVFRRKHGWARNWQPESGNAVHLWNAIRVKG